MSKTYSNDFYGGFLAGIDFERDRANSTIPLQTKVDNLEDEEAYWVNCFSKEHPHMGICSNCEFISDEAVLDRGDTYIEYCPRCGRKMKIRKRTWMDIE